MDSYASWPFRYWILDSSSSDSLNKTEDDDHVCRVVMKAMPNEADDAYSLDPLALWLQTQFGASISLA